MANLASIRADAADSDAQLKKALGLNDDPAPNADPVDPVEPTSLDGRAPTDAPHPNAIPPAPNNDATPIDGKAYAELKQKYDTLQGIHNKTSTTNAQMAGRLETLERIMAMKAAAELAAPTAPAPSVVPTSTKLVTKDEETEFGADLIEVMRQAAREVVNPIVSTLLDRIQKIDTSLAQLSNVANTAASHVAVTGENAFNDALNRSITDASGTPDWDKINHAHEHGDRSFVDWLAETGQDSDEPRLNVIQRAYQRKDAAKVIALFKAFKRDAGLPNGNAEPAAVTPPSANPADALVSPSPVAPSAPGQKAGNKKVWKLAEITSNYDKKTKGFFKGKDKEWAALMAEMDLAGAEGRISAK